jgi:hypothetical protein
MRAVLNGSCLLGVAVGSLAFAAAPAWAPTEELYGNFNFLAQPVGGSGVSAMALAGEGPGRVRTHVVVADARRTSDRVRGSMAMRVATGRCTSPGRTIRVDLEHVAGRGLEYTARVSANLLRAGSVTMINDQNGDLTYDNVACGPVKALQREGAAVVELRALDGSGVSGLMSAQRTASGGFRTRVVLADCKQLCDNEQIDEMTIAYVRGRCGSPPGRVLLSYRESDFDFVLGSTTKAREPEDAVMRRVGSMRISGDFDGDGAAERLACGNKLPAD